MQANLTPELLRTAAAVSPAAAAEAEALGGVLPTLKELVTKPGLVMGLLKSVVNLLKTRFPAMIGGANLALSMSVFGMCATSPYSTPTRFWSREAAQRFAWD